jgi:hypothetical protein
MQSIRGNVPGIIGRTKLRLTGGRANWLKN